MSYDRYVSLSKMAAHAMVKGTRRARRLGAVAWKLGSAVSMLAVAVVLDAVLIGVPLAGLFLILSALV